LPIIWVVEHFKSTSIQAETPDSFLVPLGCFSLDAPRVPIFSEMGLSRGGRESGGLDQGMLLVLFHIPIETFVLTDAGL